MAIEYRTTVQQITTDTVDGQANCITKIGSVRVFAKNTVTEVEVSIPETLEWDTPGNPFSDIAAMAQELRHDAIVALVEADTDYITERRERALAKLEALEAIPATRVEMAI